MSAEFTIRKPGLYYALGDGVDTSAVIYVLNPDHPEHQNNMMCLSRFQRAMLRTHLEQVIMTLGAADRKERTCFDKGDQDFG